MKFKTLLASALMLGTTGLMAQNFETKIIDGNEKEYAKDMIFNTANNVVITGSTKTYGPGQENVLVMEIDSSGNTLWQRAFAVGQDIAIGHSIKQTFDGGYIVTGSVTATNDEDAFLLKIDSNGDLEWVYRYGGSSVNENGREVIQLSDTTYAFIGEAANQIYVVRVNPSGTELWSNYLATQATQSAKAWSIAEASNPVFLEICGYSDESVTAFDGLALRITTDAGTPVMSRTHGDNTLDTWERPWDAYPEVGNGLWAYTGVREGLGNTGKDVLIALINQGMFVSLSKAFEGTGDEEGYSIIKTTDNNYVVTGYTDSYGGGGKDAFILKMNPNGGVMWAKTYGGTNDEIGYVVTESPTGYLVAGFDSSEAINKGGVFVVHFDPNGNTESCNVMDATIQLADHTVLDITNVADSTHAPGQDPWTPTQLDSVTTPVLCDTSTSTDVNEMMITEDNFKIYPNPSNGQVRFETTTDMKFVELYTLIGEQVSVLRTNQNHDLGKLPSGVYLVKYQLAEKLKVEKLVIR